MEPRSVSVRGLFGDECCFLIPIFQRGYVWERKTQWQPLWADICAQVERDQNYQGALPNQRCQHFMGAVVLNAHEPQLGQANRYEVIDGQQRITTLYILLAALRDVAGYTGAIDRGSREDVISHLLRNVRPHEDEKYDRKLVPTMAFLQQLNEIEILSDENPLIRLRGKYPLKRKNGKEPQNAPRMIACYLYYSSAMEAFIRGNVIDADDETDVEGIDHMTMLDRFILLRNSIFNGLQLVALHLSVNDDPQAIFESLNARGIPLTPADLIRNHIFLSGLNAEEEINQDKIYKRYWSSFDEDWSTWRNDASLGRIKMTTLDLYCFHFVVAVRGKIIPLKHLYPQFRDWWNDSSRVRGFKTTIEDFHDTAKHYLRLGGATENSTDPIEQLAALLRELDLTVAMPIALAIERKKDDLGGDLASICTYITSYVVRRLFTGVQAQGFNRIIPSIIESLNQGGLIGLTERMLKWEGVTMAWIPTDQFKRQWMSGQTYKDLGPKRTKTILQLLDRAMRTTRNERIAFDHGINVEHILPQAWKRIDYPLLSAQDSEQQTTTRNQYLHNIGNLTLLTQSLNSQISNGPFSTKRLAIAEQSSLRLNVRFQNPPDGMDTWNETAIRHRAEDLLVLALQLWPRHGD